MGFDDLGEKALKNIATPMRVYRAVADGAAARASPPKRRRLTLGAAAVVVLLGALVAGGWYLIRPAPVAAISADRVMTIKGPAIAAIPFANLSGDTEYDLFARGMTDQVAAALTRFKGVRVLSPRASAKYADDLGALRRELAPTTCWRATSGVAPSVSRSRRPSPRSRPARRSRPTPSRPRSRRRTSSRSRTALPAGSPAPSPTTRAASPSATASPTRRVPRRMIRARSTVSS